MRRSIDFYSSPIGLLQICDVDGFLARLDFAAAAAPPARPTALTRQVRAWLEAYFGGERPTWLPPIRQEGTAFRQQVWSLIAQIPYGATSTYGALAEAVAAMRGQERMSAQAVGTAVGRNAVPILVPCHRVLPADGSLGGYSFGSPAVKRRLLALEGVRLRRG